jgi:hypothetical protein
MTCSLAGAGAVKPPLYSFAVSVPRRSPNTATLKPISRNVWPVDDKSAYRSCDLGFDVREPRARLGRYTSRRVVSVVRGEASVRAADSSVLSRHRASDQPLAAFLGWSVAGRSDTNLPLLQPSWRQTQVLWQKQLCKAACPITPPQKNLLRSTSWTSG